MAYFASDYFASTYFAPDYFPGSGLIHVGNGQDVATSERAILDDIVARLAGTGVFGSDDGGAQVGWGDSLDVLFPNATGPAASVQYQGSTENPISDLDFMVRDGRYTLTIASRHPEARDRGASLSQLAAICRNALSGVPLGGRCQPYFCRLRQDQAVESSLPEGRRALSGTFRYTIEDDQSRDESGDD